MAAVGDTGLLRPTPSQSPSPPALQPVRHPLGDRDRRQVGVGARDFRHDGRVDDAQAGATDHAAIRVDHRSRIVRRTHAASAAGVLRVAAFGKHPVVELGVAERLVHGTSGRTVLDAVGDVGDGGLQADLAQAAHAVAHPNEIAAIGQHAFLHRRVDGGVRRGDADVAMAERLIDRHRDASARGAGRLIDVAGEVAGDHDHVVLT